MALRFIGATYRAFSGSGAGPIGMPAGFAAGDLLLFIDTKGGFTSLATPGGWGALGHDTSAAARHLAAQRIADGTETTVTAQGDSSIACYRNVPLPTVFSGSYAELSSAAAPVGAIPLDLPALVVPGPRIVIVGMAIATYNLERIAAKAGYTQDDQGNTSSTLNQYMMFWGHSSAPVSGSPVAGAVRTDSVASTDVTYWGQALATPAAAGGLSMFM